MSLQKAIRRQGGLCFYCHRVMTTGSSRPTREHVVPKSKGGGHKGNIVAACFRCNTSKGNMGVELFVERVLPVLKEREQMTRRQHQILKRQRLASVASLPASRKDTLRAAEADLQYAARSTAWAEPLVELLCKMNGSGGSPPDTDQETAG